MNEPQRRSNAAASAMPRFGKRAVQPEVTEDTDEHPRYAGDRTSHRRKSTEDFQERYLETKLKKEDGLADQAQTRASIEKIEYDERVGKLVTTAKAQDMLEQEHLVWIKELEEFGAGVIRRLYKKGVPLDVQEKLKDAIEDHVHDMRMRLSRVPIPGKKAKSRG